MINKKKKFEKLLSLSIFCIVFYGCNILKGTTTNNNNLENNENTRSNKEINEHLGIYIIEGNVTNTHIVGNITNTLFGLEDEFYITDVVSNNHLEKTFNGFNIVLTPTIDNPEKIKIIAQSNKKEYSKIVEFEAYESYGNLLGYYMYITFENKSWIHPEGNYSISVFDNSKKLLETNFTDIGKPLFYSTAENSPFEQSQIKIAKRNIAYTYRYRNNNKSIVVLYYSNDLINYKPLLILEPEKKGLDNFIRIQFNEKVTSGNYYLQYYELNAISTKNSSQKLFDSFYLE